MSIFVIINSERIVARIRVPKWIMVRYKNSSHLKERSVMVGDIGQRLGNYRLIRQLGQGGFAQVYLGERLGLRTQAAVNLLARPLTSDEAERFRVEARIIARRQHLQLLRVLGFAADKAS